MPFRYVPLLRTKAGESIALFQLSPAAKDRMFPILHLPAAISAVVITRIGQAWAGREIALDGLFNFDATGSGVAMQNAFNALIAAGVSVVPSVEYGAPAGYLAAVAPLAQAAGTRLVVKVRLGELPNLVGWLANGKWQLQSVDLVVTAGHIADFGAGVLNALVAHSLQNLPHPLAWRSITLAGSAAPKDHSTLNLGVNHVPRLDWQLWSATCNGLPYQLDYGDYGIAHPDMAEPPGYVMGNATVSVRYCLDHEWLIIKGRPVSGANGIPMPAQYVGHAQALVALPAFGGLPICWGDARIQQILGIGGQATPGSRQTWVEIGVNRHLSVVADRLP